MSAKFNLMFFAVFTALTPIALSHLDGGEDKIVDSYLVDFGYSPKSPDIGDKVAMTFSLLNNTNREVIEPESAWIRISSSKEVVFAGTLKQESGNVAFTYKFPYAGDYIIRARYNSENGTIVETDFNITIREKVPEYYYVIVLIVVVLLIYISVKFSSLNKKLKNMGK